MYTICAPRGLQKVGLLHLHRRPLQAPFCIKTELPKTQCKRECNAMTYKSERNAMQCNAMQCKRECKSVQSTGKKQTALTKYAVLCHALHCIVLPGGAIFPFHCLPPPSQYSTIAPPRSTFGVRKFLCCITPTTIIIIIIITTTTIVAISGSTRSGRSSGR